MSASAEVSLNSSESLIDNPVFIENAPSLAPPMRMHTNNMSSQYNPANEFNPLFSTDKGSVQNIDFIFKPRSQQASNSHVEGLWDSLEPQPEK